MHVIFFPFPPSFSTLPKLSTDTTQRRHHPYNSAVAIHQFQYIVSNYSYSTKWQGKGGARQGDLWIGSAGLCLTTSPRVIAYTKDNPLPSCKAILFTPKYTLFPTFRIKQRITNKSASVGIFILVLITLLHTYFSSCPLSQLAVRYVLHGVASTQMLHVGFSLLVQLWPLPVPVQLLHNCPTTWTEGLSCLPRSTACWPCGWG